ncbi:MAG TPA: SDR family oxidoreductase [Polyangia bacterium]|jgi:dTDP-4-dehydrorhamnose reductase
MSTVLITGAAGLLGAALLESAPAGVRLIAQVRTTPLPPALAARATVVTLDLGDEPAVAALLDRHGVSAVLHTAARTVPVDCEDHPAAAEADNVGVPRLLTRLCAARGLPLVHVSTDLVFDGRAGRPYREDDPPAPISVYGRTKAAAELLVTAEPRNLVARVPLMLGRSPTGRRSADEAIAAGVARGEVTLFADEFRTPINALLAARLLWELRARGAAGIVHVAGRDRVTRWELGCAVADRLGLPRDRLRRARLADFRGRPPRTPDVSLDTTRLAARCGWPAPSLEESLAAPLAGAPWG